MNRVSIASEWLSAEISPHGAELQVLRDAAGRDLLSDGDPAFWTGRAPLLFPIIGRLNGDAYRLDGRTYPMPKHGFARRSLFKVQSAAAESVAFTLEPNPEARAAYPFEFELAVTFAISGAALSVRAVVSNRGEAPMPASFGFHPALRWPLPYGAQRDEHRIVFAGSEPAPIRRIASDLLLPESFPTPVSGDRLHLRDDLFIDDVIIFDQLGHRSLRYGADGGPQLRFDFPAMPVLGVWTKPGAPFVCIEPWQGIADPAGFAGDIFEKPGIVKIAAGDSRTFAMTITLEDQPARGA